MAMQLQRHMHTEKRNSQMNVMRHAYHVAAQPQHHQAFVKTVQTIQIMLK